MYYHTDSPANKANTQAASVIKKRFIKTGHTCLGVSDGTGLTLTGADRHDSLLWSRRASEPAGTVHSWSPYGSGKPAAASLPGFNGERLDPVSGTYHLGKGYRAYNSVLMRFNCPDDLSPFGAGGINPYAYCAGDPVNHIDPSGHLSWQSILGITLGAIGLAAVIFTGGASIIAAGGVMAAVSSASATALAVGSLGVVADATAIASGAVEGSDPEASSILGWVSLATGLAGAATGIGMGMRSAIKNRGSYNVTKIKMAPEKGTGKSVTLGGPMRNIDLLINDLYTFADIYKGKNRLNIAAHGELVGESSRLITGGKFSGLRQMDVDELATLLKSRYNMSYYDNLRTIACYSGNGGEMAFGAQLSKAVGKPVKSYIGRVTANFEPGDLSKLFVEAETYKIYTPLQDTFSMKRVFKVDKTNSFKFYQPAYYSWGYEPVHFPYP